MRRSGSSSRSIIRLPACWVTQVPSGLALTPTSRIRRVWICMNTSTYKVLRNTVSTMMKSQATMPLACGAGRHSGRERIAAGAEVSLPRRLEGKL
jgi:hypothetical protein